MKSNMRIILTSSPETDKAYKIAILAGELKDLVRWQMVELPDGVKALALIFPLDNWEMKDGKIVSKK